MDLAAELARFGPAAPPADVTLDQARRYCRHLALTHYENFSVASRLVPQHLRQHFCNVYAYCRWADDLADEANLAQHSLTLLDWWQRQLDALFAGEVATHPVFLALAETVREFDLPRQPLADLLVAFRRDQRQTRYETLAELMTYCENSANPVGRIVLRLGRSFDGENARLSDSICTGLQLANFWQDVKRDYQRGRIYVPQEICRRHGWNESRFAAGRVDNAFRDLLRPLVDQAEELLLAGRPLADRVSRDLRQAVRLFLGGGQAVLAAIRRCRYDVWSRRPTVGRLAKLALVASAWWRG